MSETLKHRPHYTFEDYLLWEGRWELLGGMPFAMSPAPSPKHQIIQSNLLHIFYTQLRRCEHCRTLAAPLDWKVNDNTVVQPDILIVCQPIEKKYLDFPPSLIVEIISPASAEKDRHYKFEIYQENNVQHYMIVDPDFEKLELYSLIEGKYQLQKTVGDTTYHIEFGVFCKTYIDFANTWQ
jgi:Uma2 family endonuclease